MFEPLGPVAKKQTKQVEQQKLMEIATEFNVTQAKTYTEGKKW